MDPVLIVVIVAVILLIPLFWYISTSNKFKRMKIKVEEALSGIEVALTKRYDTLTKMLDVTKGYAAHEKGVLEKVISMRKGMTATEMSAANTQFDALASRINVVAEAYPELRSSDIFRELQVTLRDVEDHLQASRRLYNSNVTQYNTAIAVFPSSIVANRQNLTKCDFFAAEEAKKQDVKMEF